MTALAINAEEFQLLRAYIEEICGIRVSEEKTYLIESRLGSLVAETGSKSFQDLYFKAKNSPNSPLKGKIIDLMTTNETLWFRDVHPFRILKEKIFPEVISQIKAGKRSPASKIRLWVAASSTGQEPYSIAMIIHDLCRLTPTLRPEMFEILATDICTTALRLAFMGRYDKIAMNRGLPEDMRNRYFKDEGRVYSVSPELKKIISFKKFNLQENFAKWGKFDIILCRNVLIYFSDEFKVEIFKKFTRSLNPNGYLFLGASESISIYSSDFAMLEHGRGIYYQLRSK